MVSVFETSHQYSVLTSVFPNLLNRLHCGTAYCDLATNTCYELQTFKLIAEELWGCAFEIKEARGSFFELRVDVLKLQSRIQDKLRSPSYTTSSSQHMIKVNFLIGFQATVITIATEVHSLSF